MPRWVAVAMQPKTLQTLRARGISAAYDPFMGIDLKMTPGWEDDVTRLMQDAVDSIPEEAYGAPVAEAKAAIDRAFKARGVTLDDAALSSYAEEVSAGKRLVVGPPLT